MTNQTQKNWVLLQLRTKGMVTRNECLGRYISRLGAIIWSLKDEGYDISGEWKRTEFGRDFVYTLKQKQANLF